MNDEPPEEDSTLEAQLRRTERELQAARDGEARLQAILDSLADAVVTLDAKGQINGCNAAAATLFDVPAQELLNRALTLFVPDFSALPARGKREYLANRPDGTRVAIEIAVNPVTGSVPPQLALVISDISERKRAEDELREALTSFRQIADQIEDAFFVVEASSGKGLYASPAFASIFKRPSDHHGAESWPQLEWIHPEDRARVEQAAQGLAQGQPFALGYRIVWPDGNVRYVECSAFLVPGQNRITGIVRDVSGDRRMQDELRQAQRLESIGTLTSGVAHDFNNLLMGVGGCVQLALKRIDRAHPAQPYLRRAADSILRGASLTRQILRFSDTRHSDEGPIELDEVVTNARELVRSLLGEHLNLRVVTEAPRVHIDADAGEIEQILMNLASNARDAMPDGGSLTFSTYVEGERVNLSVSDTGTGMPESVRARAFEPFFTTKAIGRGTGLGLSTVFAVAARLGGKVSIDSAESQGTSISISFPIADLKAPRATAKTDLSATSVKRVLIVENDPLVRLTVENHLETLGCRTLSAESVSDAMMLLDEPGDSVDLAIVDVMMPSALGTKLQKQLTARGNPLPVVFMSAHPRSELIRNFGLPPNARLLAKPFNASELSNALAEAWSAASAPARTRIFLVEDNVEIADALREMLAFAYDVEVAYDGEAAIRAIPEFRPDLVVCDLELGMGTHGYDIPRALADDPRLKATRYVAVTGCDPVTCREPAIAAGFERVLGKPLDLEQLKQCLA